MNFDFDDKVHFQHNDEEALAERLAAQHAYYYESNQCWAGSVDRAHLWQKPRGVLVGDIARDYDALVKLKRRFPELEAEPDDVFDGVLGGARNPTEAELRDRLVAIRLVLFGPRHGQEGTWFAEDEVNALDDHVRSLRGQHGAEEPETEPMEEGW